MWVQTTSTSCPPRSLSQQQGFWQQSAYHSTRGKSRFESKDAVILHHFNALYSSGNRTKSVQGMLWPYCPLFWSLENYNFPWTIHSKWFSRDRKEFPWKGNNSGDVVSPSSTKLSFLHTLCIPWCGGLWPLYAESTVGNELIFILN